ncbi:MAG TPA: hypothetical protein VGM03_18225 [Phycisphaerae bacterium]
MLAAGVKAQHLVPGIVAVGGTAAALYAHHRVSVDTDHLLRGLRDRFDEVLQALNAAPEWKTARVSRPVLILGSIDNVPVGLREPRRVTSIETATVATPTGELVVPTLPEMISMKGFMLYSRNALRDYVDFAALARCATESVVLDALGKLDDDYRGLQTQSLRLEVAKSLAAARPYDLESTDLSRYKGLVPEWREWRRTEGICRHFGALLGERIALTDST